MWVSQDMKKKNGTASSVVFIYSGIFSVPADESPGKQDSRFNPRFLRPRKLCTNQNVSL